MINFDKLKKILQTTEFLAILQKSLDAAIFYYIFIQEVRLSGIRASRGDS